MGGESIGEAAGKGLLEGRIIKGVGGLYTVDNGERLWECRLRGRFRREKQDALPGDLVRFAPIDESASTGVVEEILPRANRLTRPPVANVDQILIVMAADQPRPDLWLLDKILLMAGVLGIDAALCWNKEDIADENELKEYIVTYKAAGVAQYVTSARSGSGLPGLRDAFAGRWTVLAGPSGVGKSSLLNLIEEGLGLKTGEISARLGRGKHTTRHVEWIPICRGGWVADTPGFSQARVPESLSLTDLAGFYPDFAPYADNCSYRSCLHDQSRDCGVSQGVRDALINEGRYRRYLAFLKEIKDRQW